MKDHFEAPCGDEIPTLARNSGKFSERLPDSIRIVAIVTIQNQ